MIAIYTITANIIAKLDTINSVIGIDELSQNLLPAITDLATDKKWRVRLAIIHHIPLLAKQLGTTIFETKLNDLCVSWLSDSVYQIRNAGTQNITKLVAVFGGPWVLAHIIPKIKNLLEHKSYLYRMTALNAIKAMSRDIGPEITSDKLIPIVLSMVKDPIPNVRFNVAKALAFMSNYVTPSIIPSHILPSLQTLSRDSDLDVQYFVSQSLLVIKNIQEGKAGPLIRGSILDNETFDQNLEATFLSSESSLAQTRTSDDEDAEMALVDGLPSRGSKSGK